MRWAIGITSAKIPFSFFREKEVLPSYLPSIRELLPVLLFLGCQCAINATWQSAWCMPPTRDQLRSVFWKWQEEDRKVENAPLVTRTSIKLHHHMDVIAIHFENKILRFLVRILTLKIFPSNPQAFTRFRNGLIHTRPRLIPECYSSFQKLQHLRVFCVSLLP